MPTSFTLSLPVSRLILICVSFVLNLNWYLGQGGSDPSMSLILSLETLLMPVLQVLSEALETFCAHAC